LATKTNIFSQATGALGAPVLKELIAAQKFNITIIARKDSNSTYPEGVKVVSADYESLESLTAALQNQDAVVSAVGNAGFLTQKVL
jgi:putative NADH-flavin reductase